MLPFFALGCSLTNISVLYLLEKDFRVVPVHNYGRCGVCSYRHSISNTAYFVNVALLLNYCYANTENKKFVGTACNTMQVDHLIQKIGKRGKYRRFSYETLVFFCFFLLDIVTGVLAIYYQGWYDLFWMKLPKTYEPTKYENDIYALWERTNSFKPKNRGGEGSYSIVIPPPNANAGLHMGQELTVALEDIAVRYHRMKGQATLLVPGADHAGFETWVVYEKMLNKQGKTRFDFSREELYSQVWDFVQKNKTNFEIQLRAMGVSCDWSRFTFTLDDKVVKTAYSSFKKMWDDKLIYRGERLVNFCTFHGTSFSDIEVIHKEISGHLWHIKYPLTDGSGSIVVATTRPETILGDTAVAVNPADKRYKNFVGKTIKLPLTNREIPIIVDDFVDTKFGTGAVKVTPAHDPNDFDIASRHDLPMITVISHEGNITSQAPEAYRGLSVAKARKAVLKDLESLNLLEKTTQHKHSVGHYYKCDTIIQPLLRDQWFVNMKPLAEVAIKALNDKKIAFLPSVKRQQCIEYLLNIRDWNISRQIAWGIPIPAFQNIDQPDDWIYDERVGEETIELNGKTYRRDPDVFDTWFSSGQWPFVTMGYPDSPDFDEFYPLSLMETGGEILYQWVCRMIMLGLYITGKIPFEKVYIHGYVMTSDGSKMSKSVGNVVDPMPVIQQYGSDALRMGIIAGRSPAVNRGYDIRKIEDARNFCNKLWNVARFIEDKAGTKAMFGQKPVPKNSADRWLLSRLQQSNRQISKFLDDYRFAEAYELLYHLLWDDFADWYIEASKIQANISVLAYGLETILKLAHPFAPFVSEAIWQTMNGAGDNEPLIVSNWPAETAAKYAEAREFEEIKTIVEEIRFICANLKLKNVSLFHSGDEFIARNADLIKNLSKLDKIQISQEEDGLRLTSSSRVCWLDVDQQKAQEFVRQLETKQIQQGIVVKMLKDRLKNKAYVQNAPAKVIDQTKRQLADAQALYQKIANEHKRFRSK